MEQLLLSIVIPAYNEASRLPVTVKKIKLALAGLNREEASYEIIVCDNNSNDETATIAKQLGVHVINEPINQISRARNTGANIAKGKWLLFIDADTHPTTPLMVEVLEIIQNNEQIGCGVTVTITDGTLFNKLRMERINPIFRALNLAGGAFLLCDKHAFQAINGFSEQLYAYEEIDFIIRLKKYGKTIGKKFIVLHKNPVHTSGRKGDLTVASLVKLFFSNVVAIILFLLHYLLPFSLSATLSPYFLSYWYPKNPRKDGKQ